MSASDLSLLEPPAHGGPLSPAELQRYHRHLILPEVGVEGQARLKGGSVLLVGAGGLGSPAALYLAAAGVGRLGVVDADVVDVTNLQRQVLHGTADIGRHKTASARDRLVDINPFVRVETHATRLTSANALEILEEYDVIVDGSDNFQTRYLLNDACVILGKPNVYGSVLKFEGQASVFSTPGGPCYRCLFREPPPPGLVPSCAEGGVFGVIPGLVGVIQATETIKLLIGAGDTLAGRLLLVDALRMRFHTVVLSPDPECRACGTREIRELIDYDAFCGGPAPTTTSDGTGHEIAPLELKSLLDRGEPLDLIDVREPQEWHIARIPGARLIPPGDMDSVTSALDRDRQIVVHCHHGVRSAAVVELLREAGFRHVRNLAGGIARWSAEIDPSIPQY